jgi:hypothetical protein
MFWAQRRTRHVGMEEIGGRLDRVDEAGAHGEERVEDGEDPGGDHDGGGGSCQVAAARVVCLAQALDTAGGIKRGVLAPCALRVSAAVTDAREDGEGLEDRCTKRRGKLVRRDLTRAARGAHRTRKEIS